MATLIPSISTCASRMTSGERRVAQRLEDKLDDDYLLWYDVPMGRKNTHPDFCVMHQRRGILVLEIKDWKLSTIQQADKRTWKTIPDGVPKSVINPLEQSRQYATKGRRNPALKKAALGASRFTYCEKTDKSMKYLDLNPKHFQVHC